MGFKVAGVVLIAAVELMAVAPESAAASALGTSSTANSPLNLTALHAAFNQSSANFSRLSTLNFVPPPAPSWPT